MVAMRVHPNKRKNSSRGWLVTKSGADKRANRGNIDLSDKPGDTDAYDTWLVAIPQINKYFFKYWFSISLRPALSYDLVAYINKNLYFLHVFNQNLFKRSLTIGILIWYDFLKCKIYKNKIMYTVFLYVCMSVTLIVTSPHTVIFSVS